MILRRITKHVKDQNWFAVGLDFFIVVLGILIAFQITNWSEARKERVLEVAYMERLHKEVMDLEFVREGLVFQRQKAAINLRDALTKLVDSDGGKLTPAECHYLAHNPPTSNPTDDLPLIIELLSSGRFAIFTNKDVEKALGDYLITRNRARDSRSGVVADIPNLDENYPHLYEIRGSLAGFWANVDEPTEEFFAALPITCDEDGMRANQAYLNELAYFESNFHYHTRDNRNVSRALAELHSILDGILGIEHEETR